MALLNLFGFLLGYAVAVILMGPPDVFGLTAAVVGIVIYSWLSGAASELARWYARRRASPKRPHRLRDYYHVSAN
jgi:hypothetical protein